ncbi:MAG TPA: hypothetical protein DCW31_03725 [Lactobacillus sp.]|nr:hypothetical protein [Lactobacillus sp.]
MEVFKNMDISSFLPIAESIAGGAIGAGALKGPLKSLDDWWYYFFGSKTELARQKAELLNAQKLESYKTDIYNEVKNIPPEKLQQPKLDIIGPALEASRYYIDAPELRKMFAKLVASSVDSRKETITRSAFVEFVKQMSPLDAKILSTFVSNSQSNKLPMVKINRKLANNNKIPLKSEVLSFELFSDINERTMIPSAIINLSRLGLVEVTYSEWLSQLDYTKIFSLTPEYDQCTKELQELKSQYQVFSNNGFLSNEQLEGLKTLANSSIELDQGLLTLTSLGKDFTSLCL